MTATATSEERPLVTFALFAYNQEKYIREAVQGALSQTYEPLEIILSDDCSTDRTFDIMQELAAAYRGPHTVRVRRNPINFMTAMHVQAVAQEMTGELMVVAAGDDISLPHRVARVVFHWMDKKKVAVMLHSEAEEFIDDDKNTIIRRSLRQPGVDFFDLNWFLLNQTNPTLAPTTAYSRDLFARFTPLYGGSVIEDGPLLLRAILSGVLQSIPEPLVLLRNISESAGRGFSVSNANRWNQAIRSRLVSEFNQLSDISSSTDLTQKERYILEERCLRQIRGLGRCTLQSHSGASTFGKVNAFLVFLLFYPRRGKFTGKLSEALKFSSLFSETTLKKLKERTGRR